MRDLTLLSNPHMNSAAINPITAHNKVDTRVSSRLLKKSPMFTAGTAKPLSIRSFKTAFAYKNNMGAVITASKTADSPHIENFSDLYRLTELI
jgi:hypothetical protein